MFRFKYSWYYINFYWALLLVYYYWYNFNSVLNVIILCFVFRFSSFFLFLASFSFLTTFMREYLINIHVKCLLKLLLMMVDFEFPKACLCTNHFICQRRFCLLFSFHYISLAFLGCHCISVDFDAHRYSQSLLWIIFRHFWFCLA